MKYLFPNLDFEYELLHGRRPTSRAVLRQISRWSHIMRLVDGWQDAQPSGEPADGDWLAWGESASFAAMSPRHNDLDVVKRVNGKDFSHRLELDLNIGLPGARECRSVDEVRACTADGDWLVKSPFGVAGRERLEIRDGDWSVRSLGWLERHFDLVESVVVEPRVHDLHDWSIQFELDDHGTRCLGSCALVTDSLGNHRGHRVSIDAPDSLVSDATRAVNRVWDEGYRGPVGVDAFVGELHRARIERPLCEINARMTFGRLALELSRYVPFESFYWWHPSDSRFKELPALAGEIQNAVSSGHYALPEFCDPGRESRTRIVIE